jgi:uncharacterized RDD family membrane protein YckC
MESSQLGQREVGHANSWPPADVHTDVLGRRIAASLIDFLILAALFFVLAALTHGVHDQTVTTATGYHVTRFTVSGSIDFIALVVMILYYLGFESLIGQTPGKMVTGLQVVDLDGRAASTGAILVRTVVRIVDVLPFLYLVGFISLLCGEGPRQRVGDRMAGTTVAPV